MLSSLEGPQLVNVERNPPVWRLGMYVPAGSAGKLTVNDPFDCRRSSPSAKEIIASQNQLRLQLDIRIDPLVRGKGRIAVVAEFWILRSDNY